MKAIGVDIGTAFIASARYDKSTMRTIYVRDGFFKMEYLEQREIMLKNSKNKEGEQIPFIIKDHPTRPGKKEIYVIGNEAFNLASLFSGSILRRPLKDGIISAQEKETEFILKEIINRVAGVGEPGDLAYYSVPADPVDRDFNTIYHREIFKRFLTEAGYKAKPLVEGMALAYSDLEDSDFTGVCCSLGAGMVNIAMAYKGLEIFSFSIARAGDFIDENVAKSRGIDVVHAAARKEQESFNLLKAEDDIDEAISIFYRASLEYAVRNIADALEKHRNKIKLKDPLTFVYGGGTSMPKGFHELLMQALKENPLPIPVGTVRQAKNPTGAVCIGCLKAAMADLQKDGNDGVTDISGGKNEKHQYPKTPKEVPEEIKKEKTPKEKRADVEKGHIVSGSLGITEAIDLGRQQ